MAKTIQQLSLLTLSEGKTCPQCNEWKPFTKFLKGGYVGGRSPRCRKCTDPPDVARARDRARYRKPTRNKQVREKVKRWYADNIEYVRHANHRRYETNKEKYQAWGREYYTKNKARINAHNKEYRERTRPPHVKKRVHIEWTRAEIRERKRLYRVANPEHHRELDRRRYVRDRDKRLRSIKAYHKAHPEVSQLIEARRRAQIKGSNGKVTKAEWDLLCAKYNYQCLRCGQVKKLTIDHVVPLSRGGLHVIGNIQPLCRECNASKSTRSTDYRT